jgi:hypothetical protein
MITISPLNILLGASRSSLALAADAKPSTTVDGVKSLGLGTACSPTTSTNWPMEARAST